MVLFLLQFLQIKYKNKTTTQVLSKREIHSFCLFHPNKKTLGTCASTGSGRQQCGKQTDMQSPCQETARVQEAALCSRPLLRTTWEGLILGSMSASKQSNFWFCGTLGGFPMDKRLSMEPKQKSGSAWDMSEDQEIPDAWGRQMKRKNLLPTVS